ncbi:DNA binding methylated-DNA-cysteine S-methyltransferase [Flammula alnicola]|nr:DNA binding methylated-DNA-cysteine S-methyltransferase [Flammula alnicola]KAF8968524.1 DNA binding methylated-DNA-cysteine S-methyltransferase [Flammula alnicola]
MSLDSAEFHAAVYDLVRLIPTCRVTSYGHIAKLAGMPNHSRHVGQGEYSGFRFHFHARHLNATTFHAALKFLPPNTNPPIPWHRVIGASGTISSRGPGTDGAQRQRDALVAEGVDVVTGRTREMWVDLGRFGWFPSVDEVRRQQAHNSEDEGAEAE